MTPRLRLGPALAVSLLVAALAPAWSCGGSGESGTTTASSTSTATTSGAGGASSSTTTTASGGGGAAPDPTAACAALGLPSRPFAEGPYGPHRGDLADDFTLPLADGTSFHLRARWSGCDSHVFLTDSLPVSEGDPASLWEDATDLRKLLLGSPENVHYLFVSRKKTDAEAQASISALQANLEAAFGKLSAAAAARWRDRVHVVAGKAADLGGWVGAVLGTHGKIGFAVDRLQRVRGAGDLSDVTRYSQALADQDKWPFLRNIAYAAHEAKRFDAEATLADRLSSDGATVVDLWTGEVLAEMADTTATLPTAAEMAKFDTLEVEVTSQCPDPEAIEIGNCGAWDYIANLFLLDDPANPVELARFITSYHRETHWVVDASAALPLLQQGGARAFRWSFAPSWNTQPTATRLSLRFSDRKKGARPTVAHPLFVGGDFNANYNAGRAPVDVPIPATAKKVEIVALITGHGNDAHQCAEFCNHQHEITVGGTAHVASFPMAGTLSSCIQQMEHGLTPNQAGTWWYGRGGWCPGKQVDPWVVDVTADVVPGQTATISYRGLFKGADPPADGGGNISMVSWLVVHE